MNLNENLQHLNILYQNVFLSLLITVDANLSPEGSPVNINIFFILLK